MTYCLPCQPEVWSPTPPSAETTLCGAGRKAAPRSAVVEHDLAGATGAREEVATLEHASASLRPSASAAADRSAVRLAGRRVPVGSARRRRLAHDIRRRRCRCVACGGVWLRLMIFVAWSRIWRGSSAGHRWRRGSASSCRPARRPRAVRWTSRTDAADEQRRRQRRTPAARRPGQSAMGYPRWRYETAPSIAVRHAPTQ